MDKNIDGSILAEIGGLGKIVLATTEDILRIGTLRHGVDKLSKMGVDGLISARDLAYARLRTREKKLQTGEEPPHRIYFGNYVNEGVIGLGEKELLLTSVSPFLGAVGHHSFLEALGLGHQFHHLSSGEEHYIAKMEYFPEYYTVKVKSFPNKSFFTGDFMGVKPDRYLAIAKEDERKPLEERRALRVDLSHYRQEAQKDDYKYFYKYLVIDPKSFASDQITRWLFKDQTEAYTQFLRETKPEFYESFKIGYNIGYGLFNQIWMRSMQGHENPLMFENDSFLRLRVWALGVKKD